MTTWSPAGPIVALACIPPVRSAPVFGATVKLIVALPLPLVVPSVSHGASLASVHSHVPGSPNGPYTCSVVWYVPPPDDTLCPGGVKINALHAVDGGCPICVTVKDAVPPGPRAMMRPVRDAGAVLTPTTNDTTPSAVPVGSEVIVIHDTSVDSDQPHDADSLVVPGPPMGDRSC